MISIRTLFISERVRKSVLIVWATYSFSSTLYFHAIECKKLLICSSRVLISKTN